MSIAVIKTGGKQHKIKVGDKITVEKIEGKDGKKITFKEVLFVGDEKKVNVGTPKVKGASVEAKIIKQTRGKKLLTIKHKAKKRQLKKMGHRQDLTEIEIVKINARK